MIEKILIVDDEEAMRDSCAQVLEREGYALEMAENGETGLEKIRSFDPDLVLLDLKMPGLSGMEVLDRTRNMDPNLVIVVITGYATVESAVEAMKYGAYDYLPKPFTPDELRLIVRRGLERRRIRMERDRLQEEKETMRKNFVSLVSHELRAPLDAVQQNLMVILDGLAGEIPEKARLMLKRASRRIKGLHVMINDWLNLSRLESGEVVTRMEPVDIREILTEVTELMKPLMDEKRLTLDVEIPAQYPSILGNKETLHMLFTNLLSNAIKYNKPDGRIFVQLAEEDHRSRVVVADTGVGIPREKLGLIFDQFYRTRETEKVEGSGLGLSIVRKIVEAHSGDIRVESEPDKGTTFTVYLP
ncbi:MAG TPA: response regulator [bacterium]|nr:response regulator [bacterium]